MSIKRQVGSVRYRLPVYLLPAVRDPARAPAYLVFGRARLAYPNLVEKFNCAYCSYGNGLAAYLKEVVGRTEQYWCPIRHAQRVLQAHPYYGRFLDCGDAEAYLRQLQVLRTDLANLDAEEKKQQLGQ